MSTAEVKAEVIEADVHVVESGFGITSDLRRKNIFFPSTAMKEGGAWFCLKRAPIPLFGGVYPERSRMGSGQAFPVRDCVAISKSRVIIPNESEGS